jgi:predicted MFS family arabinose efflux permease
MIEAQHTEPAITRNAIVAAIIISALGAIFYNVLPLYLGTAQDSKALSNSQLGLISTAFFVGYNLVTLSAFYWIRALSWRLITCLALPLGGACLYASTLTDSYALLLGLTTLAGGAFAVVYGIGTTIISDTDNPTRWYGLKIAAEAGLGAALLVILPGTLVAQYGFDGMIWGILITLAALSPVLLILPRSGRKVTQTSADPVADITSDGANSAIWFALLATLAFFTGTSAVWAFMERLGNAYGFDSEAIGTLLALTLIFATSGSLAVAAIGRLFGNFYPFIFSVVSIFVSLVILNIPEDFTLFAAGCCLFSIGFGAGLPLIVAEVAELDHDGRYTVLSVPAVGLGAMIGPAIAGFLFTENTAQPVIIATAAAMSAAALFAGLAYVGGKRAARKT